MKLFNPASLLWLLVLVPVIVFFYLLKLKRREMTVGSTMLWSRVVKDVQANAPFQKLKRSLLLLLQLLIAFLVVFALSRPAVLGRGLGGSSVVVVLDGSASMQSRDASGGSRFDEAKRKALRMVGDMQGGDRMMVLLAGNRTERLSAFTGDRGELTRAIREAEPRDSTTNLRDAALLAASVAGQQAGGRIFLFSDGAFPQMDDLDARGSEILFEKIGSRGENVGIVALDVRRAFSDKPGFQVFAAVRNYDSKPRKCNLEFYRNDALIDVRPIDLPAADALEGYSERSETLRNLAEGAGILRARLDIQDDLAVDNEAFAQLTPRRSINVLLVTEANLYLQKALNLDPQVKLSTIAPAAYDAQTGFDVTVFDGVEPKRLGPGSHLYINCGGATAPVDVTGKTANVHLVTWERTHPVMRYVKLGNLDLIEALVAKKRPWGVTVAEHEEGVAMAVGERDGVKSAYVGFPLLRTDFPLRVAFPIFFGNVVQWLAASPGGEGLQFRAGDTVSVPVPAGAGELTVTAPDDKKTKVTPTSRIAYFPGADKAGVYRVQGKGLDERFAVNLLSRDESATRPRDNIQFGQQPVQAGAGRAQSSHEVWRWLVLAALLVLGLEWWVYHRRI